MMLTAAASYAYSKATEAKTAGNVPDPARPFFGTHYKRTDAQAQAGPQAGLPNAPGEASVSDEAGSTAPADDAPMTPVVYLVLWTSIAVGVLRGYIISDTTAARQTPSYTRTFSGVSQAYLLLNKSPFCSTGVDGLPGISWYESLIELLPLLAPLLGAGLLKKRGRCMGVMLGCFLAIVGQVLLASAVHVVMLYIGSAVVRSASDILYLSSGMQIIEIAPRTSRGAFLMAHMLGVAFGTVLAAVLGFFVADQGPLGWRLLFGVGALPAATILVVIPWLYETPNSLIQRGEFAKGWAALREVRGPFFDAFPEYQAIVSATAAMPHSINMYWQLVANPIHRPAISVGVILALLSSLLNPMSMTYVSYSAFRVGGYRLKWAVFLSSICTAGAYALGVVVASVLVDRAGRLILLRLGSLLAIVTLLAMVIVSAVHSSGSTGRAPQATPFSVLEWAWGQVAILSILSAVNGIAWSSVVWVTIIESQALVIRPAGFALCIAFSGLGASLIETKLLCKLGLYYYIIVLALSVMSMFISLLLVPETAKAPLESITHLWLNHWLWRRVLNERSRASSLINQRSASKDHIAAVALAAAAAATRNGPANTFDGQLHDLRAELSGIELVAAELHHGETT